MATIKNIPDSYTINVPLMTVNGNLVVLGNTSTIESNTVSVYDNTIILNAGLSPGNVANPLGAYVEVDRGSSANVSVHWNESLQTWQVTNNGTNYGNVVNNANGTIVLDGNVQLQVGTVAPTVQTGYTAVYSSSPGGGGSGVYVADGVNPPGELATQNAAIKYAIIFG